jgi:hypothetical protein
MKIKLSKSQWEQMGRKAGWMIKEANLPQAQNQQVAKLGQSINFLYSKLMPNLQQEVGKIAGDLIRAFDSAFAKQDQFEQGANQQQQPQQQQPQQP